ncbi:hypothetical protein FACS1894110_18420 [Spirochaetia bacterium]|nr:hypothetical protein FACS1894110_18420 [Spirochaetia bacterium]
MSLHSSGEYLHCFSCNESFNIYAAAASILGVPNDKAHFGEICRDIEKTLGIPSEKWKPGRDFYNRNKMMDGRQMPPLSKSAVFRDALLSEFAAAVDGGNMALAQDKAAFLFALYCLPEKADGPEPVTEPKKPSRAAEARAAQDKELMRMYEKIRKENGGV